MKRVLGIAGASLLLSCGRPATRVDTVPAKLTPAQAAQFDSGTIDRLCVDPSRVRARLADCVLKDQSRLPGFAPKRPPPQ